MASSFSVHRYSKQTPNIHRLDYCMGWEDRDKRTEEQKEMQSRPNETDTIHVCVANGARKLDFEVGADGAYLDG